VLLEVVWMLARAFGAAGVFRFEILERDLCRYQQYVILSDKNVSCAKETCLESKAHVSVTVESIMTTKVHCVRVDMTVQEAIGLLLSHRIHGAPVVDTVMKVLTVITEGDLLRLAAKKGLTKTIGQCLDSLPETDDVVTLKKSASFTDLYKTFLNGVAARVIITDDTGRIQGVVSQIDVLKLLYGPKSEAA
jgi:predicted transcriptional regulator